MKKICPYDEPWYTKIPVTRVIKFKVAVINLEVGNFTTHVSMNGRNIWILFNTHTNGTRERHTAISFEFKCNISLVLCDLFNVTSHIWSPVKTIIIYFFRFLKKTISEKSWKHGKTAMSKLKVWDLTLIYHWPHTPTDRSSSFQSNE